jgi:hypothetical protein
MGKKGHTTAWTYRERLSALPVQPGDQVIVPKGVQVQSSSPSRGTYEAGRTYSVTVHHVFPETRLCGQTRKASVRWVGAGGYWCECEMWSVRRLEDPV